MTSRARLAGLSAVAALAAVAVIGGVLASQSGTAGPRGPAPTTTVKPGIAPTPPAHGTYFGAYVQPEVYTQQAKIAAVQRLERQIGRPLDIVHTYLTWHEPFPDSSDLAFMRNGSMLLVSWAGTDTRAIASGADDNWIRQRARAIKATGKPIFLEWRWEMNRPNLSYQVHSPADYIAAWDHIRAIFAQEHVNNVAWVWCPSAWAFGSGLAQAFYPGNNEVDWVCADVYPKYGHYQTFAQIVQPVLRWAAHHPKPIMIGEYGIPASYSPPQRAQWLSEAAKVAREDSQVKALLYFDAGASGPQSAPSYTFSLGPGSPALHAFRSVADEGYFDPRGLTVADG